MISTTLGILSVAATLLTGVLVSEPADAPNPVWGGIGAHPDDTGWKPTPGSAGGSGTPATPDSATYNPGVFNDATNFGSIGAHPDDFKGAPQSPRK